MKLNKRLIRLTIQKFSDCLDCCYYNKLTTDEVVKFFGGKERARRWCGSKGDSYPDIDMVQWYEKRYKEKWIFAPEHEYYNPLRFIRRKQY